MYDPFDDLVPAPQGDAVSGHMVCSECGDMVLEGLYREDIKELTYKCVNGHMSILEDYIV